jgi:hypothetical protein
MHTQTQSQHSLLVPRFRNGAKGLGEESNFTFHYHTCAYTNKYVNQCNKAKGNDKHTYSRFDFNQDCIIFKEKRAILGLRGISLLQLLGAGSSVEKHPRLSTFSTDELYLH